MNYSEEEKEAIEQLRSWRDYIIKNKDKVNKANDIEFYLRTALNLIQKQNKIIDKFSKALVNCVGTCPIDYNDDFENDCENCQDTLEKCWIEFFKKEVEKDVKD